MQTIKVKKVKKNTCITEKTGRSRQERKSFSRAALNIPTPQATIAEPLSRGDGKKGVKIDNLSKLQAIKLRLHLESQNQQGSVRYRQIINHLNKFK